MHSSVVDPKLFVTNPDPDLTFQRVSDLDPEKSFRFFIRMDQIQIWTLNTGVHIF
jgi:hypothetical protein